MALSFLQYAATGCRKYLGSLVSFLALHWVDAERRSRSPYFTFLQEAQGMQAQPQDHTRVLGCYADAAPQRRHVLHAVQVCQARSEQA